MLTKKLMPLLAMVALAAGACESASRLEAEYLPEERKADFQPRPGMSREQVEGVYGIPTDIGDTKDGQVYAQYKFGEVVRSVVYDANDRVVVAYP